MQLNKTVNARKTFNIYTNMASSCETRDALHLLTDICLKRQIFVEDIQVEPLSQASDDSVFDSDFNHI